MSIMNLHPPQTYSRLFRPWDTNRDTSTTATTTKPSEPSSSSSSSTSSSPATTPTHVKREYDTPNALNIKSEHTSFSGNESDRECASNASSSSYKSSYEDGLNNSYGRGTSTPIAMDMSQLPQTINDSPAAAAAAATTPTAFPLYSASAAMATTSHSHLPQSSQQPQLPFMPTPPAASDLYYAAAAAAAAAAANGMGSTATYGMDAYTLGLMEHEYARVMAEDAQLKALNARKQRPKKFKCPHCDVAFSNNGQLKGHIRIHTGERPFKCDVETCGKTFTRNEELTRHKRIHTGLRPYPCTACGKKFGRRDHLKKHMKTHMPQERQMGPAIFVPMYPYLYGY